MTMSAALQEARIYAMPAPARAELATSRSTRPFRCLPSPVDREIGSSPLTLQVSGARRTFLIWGLHILCGLRAHPLFTPSDAMLGTTDSLTLARLFALGCLPATHQLAPSYPLIRN